MQSLSYIGPNTWNKHLNNLKTTTSINWFEHNIKKFFLKKLKTELLLMITVLKPLAKSILIPVGLTAAVSATDAVLHQKMWTSKSEQH